MVRKANDILQAAYDYIGRGIPVFPCKGKTPATTNGFKDATTDKKQVEKWFADGKANIGIPTGPASGFWVLDLDGPEGVVSFEYMQVEHGKVPETPLATTGGDGQHMLFKMNGVEIRNTTKLCGKDIDVRGTGGYIIAAPSKHESGKRYAWVRSLDEAPLVEAPDWLVRLVTEKPKAPSPPEPAPAQPQPSFTFQVAADLATAPGEKQGSRHDVAKRLIGAEFAAGTPVEKVAELALGFAGRCTPPMDADEALRLVSDLNRKRAAQTEAHLDALDDLPLPPSLWPTLSTAALHGVAGDTVRAIEPHSEADPAALLVQLLVMFGNVVGRQPYFPIEGSRHCCNLFCCVVGSTSRGRKGTGGDRAKSLFQFIDPEWTGDRIQGGLVSGEGLIFHVRDPVLGANKKTGELEIIDQGVSDKRLMILESEFASVLRAAKRETCTLSPVLRQAWDGVPVLRTLAKNAACKATGAHVSIAAHITAEELAKTLAEVEIFSGLGNRLLWVAARRSKLLPSGGGDLDLTSFAERLARAYQAAKRIERMRRDHDAERLWERLYREFAETPATGLVAAVTSRAEAQTLRLSMLYALLDGSDIIAVEHLDAAAALWRYCEQTAVMLFKASTGSTLDDKLLSLIREHPGISRRDLHRQLANNIVADVLVAALARLRDGGHIRIDKVQGSRGRPAERYYPADGISSFVRTPNQEQAPAAGGISSFVRNAEPETEEGSI